MSFAVGAVNACHFVHADWHELVFDRHEQRGGVTCGSTLGTHLHHALQIVHHVAVCPSAELVESTSQFGGLDGLEQIVHAVDGEGIKGILVIGGSEHDGYGDLHFLKEGEG